MRIEDCAEDGGEEFFTEMQCVLNRIPIESLKICKSNTVTRTDFVLSQSASLFTSVRLTNETT